MANPDDAVISLYEASKRLGLRDRADKNWTPFLKTLCSRANVEVRDDDRGVPCCRAADLPRLKEYVSAYINRPRPYAGDGRRRAHKRVGGAIDA